MKMSAIRPGMRLRSTLDGAIQEVTVTELTDRGFTYTCEPFCIHPLLGTISSGEHYGVDGEAMFEEIIP